MPTATTLSSFLSTTRGKLTLALLCAVAFIDFVDASIVNIALPSMRRALHFSDQGLQWVPSGYLLTYGGFMLLGGRPAISESPSEVENWPAFPLDRGPAPVTVTRSPSSSGFRAQNLSELTWILLTRDARIHIDEPNLREAYARSA